MATVTETSVGTINNASAASHAFSGVTIAAGKLAIIRLMLTSNTVNVNSVTDSAGNTWGVAISQARASDAHKAVICYCVLTNALSGGTVTINLSAATACGAHLAYFDSTTGWEPQATVLDQKSGANQDNSTSWSSGATPTTIVDEELLVGVASRINVNGSSSTPAAGWTEETDQVYSNLSTAWMSTMWQKVSAKSAYTASGTWTAAEYSSNAIATFIVGGQVLPAFPVVAAVAESANPTTAATSHTVDYPAGIQAGDTLLMIADKGSTAATVNAITGWTELIDENSANGLYAAYKKADGTETGTFTVTSSASTRMVFMVYRITGAADPTVTPPEIGTTATGTSLTPDPPAITPAGGSKDYLFITFAGMAGEEADDDTWGNTPPTGYNPSPPRQKTSGTVGTNLGGLLIAAERGLTGTTDNPGTFNVDVSAAWRANTIAVYPAPSGPATQFGVVAKAFTFGEVTAAQRKTFAQVAKAFTFGEVTAAQRKTFGQTATPLSFVKDVSAQRKTFGQVALPIGFVKDVAARRQTFGQVAFPITDTIATAGFRVGNTLFGVVAFPMTFSKNVSAQRKTFGQIAVPVLFSKEFVARRTTFGQTVSPFSVGIAVSGIRLANNYFGTVLFPMTFGKDVRAQRKTFGQIALPTLFSKDVSAQRKTFSSLVLPVTFSKNVLASRKTFGQIVMPTVFGENVVGNRKTFGQISLPIVLAETVSGKKHTFGVVALPVNFNAFVDGFAFTGPKTLFGQVVFPISFTEVIAGRKQTFGQNTFTSLFGATTQGQRKTFSGIVLPVGIDLDVLSGQVETFGQVSLPILISIDTFGKLILPGIVLNDALDIYLGDIPVVAVYTNGQRVWP